MDREMTPDDVFLSLCLAQGIHPGDGAADGERDRATVKLVASTMLQQMTDGSGANRAKANRRGRAAAHAHARNTRAAAECPRADSAANGSHRRSACLTAHAAVRMTRIFMCLLLSPDREKKRRCASQ